MLKKYAFILIIVISFSNTAKATFLCGTVMFNPVSDICWNCFFPIRIGAISMWENGMPDPINEGSLLGYCPMAAPPYYRVGVNVSYWEPVTLTDVVKQPWCMESLGFSINTPNSLQLRGDDSYSGSGNSFQSGRGSNYDVHWYHYPIFKILDLVREIACMQEDTEFDVAYMTEIDISWLDSEETSAVLFPEATLFNNVVSDLACTADALVTLTGFSTAIDPLFWCQGGQGSMYPFVGKTTTRQSPLANAVEILQKFNAKLHRQGFVMESHSGNPANCALFPDVYLPKMRYRYQLTRPTPSPEWCYPYGTTTAIWEAGRALPLGAVDNYGFVNYRKHSCVVF